MGESQSEIPLESQLLRMIESSACNEQSRFTQYWQGSLLIYRRQTDICDTPLHNTQHTTTSIETTELRKKDEKNGTKTGAATLNLNWPQEHNANTGLMVATAWPLLERFVNYQHQFSIVILARQGALRTIAILNTVAFRSWSLWSRKIYMYSLFVWR